MEVFRKKNWYRGNLHSHSNLSDGEKDPKEAIDWYRKRFDFMALTDHNIYHEGRNYDDFLVFSGIEMACHTVGFGLEGWSEDFQEEYILTLIPGKWPPVEDPKRQQEEINRINEAKGIAFLGHPYWHGLTQEYLNQLEGYHGVEVYNSESDYGMARGHSVVHWDYLLTKGMKVFGYATDDIHWTHNNAGTGWITVNSNALTQEEILHEIRAGNYYSSQGPEIYQLRVEEGYVHVETSPCKRINFMVDLASRGKSFFSEEKTLKEAKYKIPKGLKYVRVECVNRDGLYAWSNPLWF